MKTTGSILTKITLSLLIAGSLAACNNNKDAGTTAPTPTSTGASLNKETIVFVNSDTLMSKYEYAKDMGTRLADKGKSAQNEIASRSQAFQRDYAEYQRNAATMAADQRQGTEQRLQRKQQELQQYQQNATAEFQNEQGAESSKLYDKISDFAKAYAKEKGYKFVLTFSKSNPTVLFGDPSLDVTADVLKRLNEAYAKEKK